MSHLTEIGSVLSLKDGILSVVGLPKAFVGELLLISGKKTKSDNRATYRGLVVGLQETVVEVVLLEGITEVFGNAKVFRTKVPVGIFVNYNTLGSVIDPLGEPIRDLHIFSSEVLKSKKKTFFPVSNPETMYQALFNNAPDIISREPVNTPLYTGYKAVDALIPIGLGQRELIIGDRKTGKTAMLLDIVINQKDKGVLCVYVMTGQKKAELARICKELEERDSLEHTIIVSADASQPAGMQYLSVYAGVSIAEYFRKNNENVVVLFDDYTKHADAYRQMSLLLRRPPGREAFPGDVFYLHSRALERSANMKKEIDEDGNISGGSVTAFPVVETQGGDVSGYIATNVISITDGQIFLDKIYFNKGIRPAVNVGLSVSRVGSAAQSAAMKKVAGTLKLDLAQYRENAAFAQFGSDLDATTLAILHRGSRLIELLKQKRFNPFSLAQQVIVLFAGTKGFFDEIEISQISDAEQKVYSFLSTYYSLLIGEIELTEDFSRETELSLRDALAAFLVFYKKSVSIYN